MRPLTAAALATWSRSPPVAASPLPGKRPGHGMPGRLHHRSTWSGGFTAKVAVTDLGDRLTGWALSWDWTAGQRVTQG